MKFMEQLSRCGPVIACYRAGAYSQSSQLLQGCERGQATGSTSWHLPRAGCGSSQTGWLGQPAAPVGGLLGRSSGQPSSRGNNPCPSNLAGHSSSSQLSATASACNHDSGRGGGGSGIWAGAPVHMLATATASSVAGAAAPASCWTATVANMQAEAASPATSLAAAAASKWTGAPASCCRAWPP